MSHEAKKWIRVHRRGRMKGADVNMDQETWEYALKHANIPLETPIEELRICRYVTKTGNIILKIKHKDKIPEHERY